LRNIGIDRDERAVARFQCDYPVEKIPGCAHRFLAEFPFTGRELVYSDPPVSPPHPHLGAALPFRLHRTGSSRPFGTAEGPVLCGDPLRLPLGAL
jgi:hypothetical protein